MVSHLSVFCKSGRDDAQELHKRLPTTSIWSFVAPNAKYCPFIFKYFNVTCARL